MIIKGVIGILVVLLSGIIIYASTAHTNNMGEKLNTKIQINKTRIELIYGSLERIETKIDNL